MNINLLSHKEKFRALRSVKKVKPGDFWDMKNHITIDFHEKDAAVNSASYGKTLWRNSPYLLNDLSILRNMFVYIL